VLLHYYQGLPVKDIARILHVAVSTVSVRLMRARTMLKDALEEWYHDE
jgi:RNA polymerase sigma-70 factor (ECF subfamily)